MVQDLRVERLERIEGQWQHAGYWWDAESVKRELERVAGSPVSIEGVIQQGDRQWKFFVPTPEQRKTIYYEDLPF